MTVYFNNSTPHNLYNIFDINITCPKKWPKGSVALLLVGALVGALLVIYVCVKGSGLPV